MDNKVNALYNGNRIECGACRALLMMKTYPHGIEGITGETGTEFMKNQEPRFIRKMESEPYNYEIKCKARIKPEGRYCNQINIVYR
jgi:LSD1 subclass zinc finger protein